MTDVPDPGPLDFGGPDEVELTAKQKLAALDAYLKVLDPIARALRAEVERQMGKDHDERVGAFLPDGTKLASITRSDGAKKARITDPGAALRWCLRAHPEHIYTIEAIRPAFLTLLLDAAKTGSVGEHGYDPSTGEVLDFITVEQGSAYVTVKGTDEGKARMTALAHGFAGMLEGPQ